MTTLVDNFGGTLPIFVLGIFEVVAIFYFYGMENVCIDLEFMTRRRPSFYWRICWIFLAPMIMSIVYIYSSFTMKPLQYANQNFPTQYLIIGWGIFAFAMMQLLIWFLWHISRSAETPRKAFIESFKSSKSWGPRKETDRNEWLKYREEVKLRNRTIANASGHSKFMQKINLAFGRY